MIGGLTTRWPGADWEEGQGYGAAILLHLRDRAN